MTKVQYEVIGNIAGHKRGSVVSLPDGDVPRPYAGRVRKLPKGASAGTITVDIEAVGAERVAELVKEAEAEIAKRAEEADKLAESVLTEAEEKAKAIVAEAESKAAELVKQAGAKAKK